MSKDDALYEMVAGKYPLFTRELQRELKRVQHKNNGPPLGEENICEVAQKLSEDLYAFIKANGYLRFEDESRLLCHHGRLKLTERGLKHISKYIYEAFGYRSNLRKMSDDLFDEELRSFRQERDFVARQRHNSEDRYAFFNEVSAEARFDYWLKIPVWTLDEAVALSLGKDPDVVSITKLRSLLKEEGSCSSFFKEYEQRSRHLQRTVSDRTDLTPLRTFDFLPWAVANFAHVPQQFRSALGSRRRYKQETNAEKGNTSDVALENMDPKNRHGHSV